MSASHSSIRSTNQNVVSISQVGKTPIRHFESICLIYRKFRERMRIYDDETILESFYKREMIGKRTWK